ncbi:MAG: hypothetical protein L0216_03560 [Planctomycetales bacterium]|nr:hypothetical protein [Planctomycetales bacterium]
MNIGPRGCRMRLVFGVASFAVAAGLGAAVVGLGAPRAARAAVALPLWIGALGVAQALAGT